jgi:hypothetical protein
MIEEMMKQIKEHLPLKISAVKWNNAEFHMHGPTWNFTTLSAWRITTKHKMQYGCYDQNSEELISQLIDLEIVDIGIQTDSLKIDPVFIFCNNQKIEIFSTDIYEPWILQIDGIGFFSATPSEPKAFDTKLCN